METIKNQDDLAKLENLGSFHLFFTLSYDDKRSDENFSSFLEEFLMEDVHESLHKMIRTNVLTATRNFQHRVNAFRK